MDSLGMYGPVSSGLWVEPWPTDLFGGAVGFLTSYMLAPWGGFYKSLAAALVSSILTAGFHFSLAGQV
jgi:hypothetical protein